MRVLGASFTFEAQVLFCRVGLRRRTMCQFSCAGCPRSPYFVFLSFTPVWIILRLRVLATGKPFLRGTGEGRGGGGAVRDQRCLESTRYKLSLRIDGPLPCSDAFFVEQQNTVLIVGFSAATPLYKYEVWSRSLQFTIDRFFRANNV